MSAGTEPYADALSRDKVMNFGVPYMSRVVRAARAVPWSIATDCTGRQRRRRRGRRPPARRARKRSSPGRTSRTRPVSSRCSRRTTRGTRSASRTARKIYKRRRQATCPMNIPYQLNLATLSNQAASVISKLKADHITTVVCGCDPIFPVYLTQRAARAELLPRVGRGRRRADRPGHRRVSCSTRRMDARVRRDLPGSDAAVPGDARATRRTRRCATTSRRSSST